MNNSFNKMLTDFLGKMDEKVLEARVKAALEMLKNGDTDELANKLNKLDKNELASKINELDADKLKNLNINKEDFKGKINDADLQKLSGIFGDQGDELVKKFKDMLK